MIRRACNIANFTSGEGNAFSRKTSKDGNWARHQRRIAADWRLPPDFPHSIRPHQEAIA